jgi:hypothetical protein
VYPKQLSEKPEEWVDTGNSVAMLYSTSGRDEAAEHAVARNKLFQAATDAFKAGDRRRATEFSKKGRFHQQKMDEIQLIAGRRIFYERNPRVITNGGSSTLLDMHGLHVKEGLVILQECGFDWGVLCRGDLLCLCRQLEKFDESQPFADVLTGTGHHSAAKSGSWGRQLRPAVLKWLDENGFKYRELAAGGHGGCVRVFLHASEMYS